MYAYLWDRLNQLEQELRRLKKENKEIKEQIAGIKPLVVERLEYKIQELDIETLSGTLNVGLTAHGDEKSMEKLVDQIMQKERTNFDLGSISESNHSTEESNDTSQDSSNHSSLDKDKNNEK